MVLSHDPAAYRPDGLVAEHLFDHPMYVAMWADHLLAEAAPLALERFAAEPWMLATRPRRRCSPSCAR